MICSSSSSFGGEGRTGSSYVCSLKPARCARGPFEGAEESRVVMSAPALDAT